MLFVHVESHRCCSFVKLAKTVSGREVIEFEGKYLRRTKQKGKNNYSNGFKKQVLSYLLVV